MSTKTILAVSLYIVCFFAMNAAFSSPTDGNAKAPEVSRDSFINGPTGDKDYNADDKKFKEPENPLTPHDNNRLPTASPSKDRSIHFKGESGSSEALKDTKGFEPVQYDFEIELDPIGG